MHFKGIFGGACSSAFLTIEDCGGGFTAFFNVPFEVPLTSANWYITLGAL